MKHESDTLATSASCNAAWRYLHSRGAIDRPVSLLFGCPRHGEVMRRRRDARLAAEARGHPGVLASLPLFLRGLLG